MICMKILFVSTTPLEYSSSANMRNIGLIKGLIEGGNKVYLLAPIGDKNSKHYNKAFEDIKFEKRYYVELGTAYNNIISNNSKNKLIYEMKDKIKLKIHNFIIRLSIYDPRKRLAQKFNINEIDTNFDIMVSSSDPKSSHLLAEKLYKSNKIKIDKWIQYWGDPFLHDINSRSLIPKRFIKNEEERLINFADKIIYVSPFTLELQQKTYSVNKDKMKFIPVPYMEKKYYEKIDNEKFTIGYFGDYYSKDRNIYPFYDCLCKMGDDIDVKIYGNTDLDLKTTKSISINSRCNYQIIKKEESNCDLLVCILNKNGTQIPGKVYHYASTNKPILLILDGEKKEEMSEYFKQFNRFILCENKIESISEAIKSAKYSNIEYNPSPEFEYKEIAKKFINS
ncbi:hypothetical protein ACJOWY_14710 [Paraclostridium bifermentans]